MNGPGDTDALRQSAERAERMAEEAEGKDLLGTAHREWVSAAELWFVFGHAEPTEAAAACRRAAIAFRKAAVTADRLGDKADDIAAFVEGKT